MALVALFANGTLLLPSAFDAELQAALTAREAGASGEPLGAEQHHDARHRGREGQDERQPRPRPVHPGRDPPLVHQGPVSSGQRYTAVVIRARPRWIGVMSPAASRS